MKKKLDRINRRLRAMLFRLKNISVIPGPPGPMGLQGPLLNSVCASPGRSLDLDAALTAAGGGWSQTEAVYVCMALEAIAPPFGCHVALTGGCLYKPQEPRKDLDVLFYRIRQTPEIDIAGLFKALAAVGFMLIKDCGWCVKFSHGGKNVDVFFPERPVESLPKRIFSSSYSRKC